MRFDKGIISAYFVTDPRADGSSLEDPYILVAKQRISAVKDLLHVLEKVMQTGKPVFIIAEDVEGGCSSCTAAFRARSGHQPPRSTADY